MKVLLSIAAFCLSLQLLYGQSYHATYFQREELINDILFFKEKIIDIHPAFIDSNKQEKWRFLCDSITTELVDSMSTTQFFLKFSSLLAQLNDGHTNFLFPYNERMKYMKNGGLTMPFTVKSNNGKIFIDGYFGEDQSLDCDKSEIVSMNGKDISEIVNSMRKIYGAETNSVKDKSVADNFGACYWMLYGENKEFNLVLSKEGKQSKVTINAVTVENYFELKKKYSSPVPASTYSLNFMDNNKIALLKIESFAQPQTLTNYLRFAFDTINQLQCKNLMIDVRDNFGGTSTAVDSLMNYLIVKPYSQFASIALRTSKDAKNKYKDNWPDFYKTFADYPDNGLYYYNDTLLVKIPSKNKNLFNGNIFVLTSNRTYSAAATFAGIIKHYQLGKIVGQPTGEPIQYYADFLQFQLPNTELKFVVSIKEFVQYGNSNLNQGVAPDIILPDDSSLDEIISILNFK